MPYGYGYYYGVSPVILVLFVASLVLSLYASTKVNSNFRKYSNVYSKTGLTGMQVARRILDSNGLYNVRVEMCSGRLSDHFDPRRNIIRLSSDVYNSHSIAAISVAAHECGHAIQFQQGYSLLKFRNTIAGPVSIASNLSWVFIILGLAVGGAAEASGSYMLMDIGILLFATVVLFHLVTLPVELNASKRAIAQMEDLGLVFTEEKVCARKMLSAAALTYLAALAAAVVQLLRLLALRGRD